MTRLEIDYSKGHLTEHEIQVTKNRFNQSQCSEEFSEEIKKEFYDSMPPGGYEILADQTIKGLDWLLDKWKTPTGRIRKNNPFGWREQEILENFKEFRLIEYINTSRNSLWDYYTQVYRVISTNGSSFSYYMEGGEVMLI